MYKYTHTHTPACMHAHMHVYMHIYIHACIKLLGKPELMAEDLSFCASLHIYIHACELQYSHGECEEHVCIYTCMDEYFHMDMYHMYVSI